MSTSVDDCVDVEVDALATRVSAMTVRDRRELLLLAKRKDELMENIEFLNGTKRYISRKDRDLISTFLSIYERRCNRDCSIELDELRKSTQNYLSVETRSKIRCVLADLLTRFSIELESLRLCNDNERFTSMVDRETVFEKDWIKLRSIGVVMCHVLPHVKKIELSGTKPEDQFYADVKTHWSFQHPEQYFVYTGGVSVPEGTIEIAGSHLEMIEPFVTGFRLGSGSSVQRASLLLLLSTLCPTRTRIQ